MHGEGATKTYEFNVWVNMRNRCSNPKNRAFPSYGGRGIRVCDRWQQFTAFLEDMGRAPSKGYSIDRINNDGNYEPGNCRWATKTTQARNKRTTRHVTLNGVTKPLKEWQELGILKVSTVQFYNRVRAGLSEADALTIPPRQRG